MSDIRANTISDAAGTGPIDLHKQSASKVQCNFSDTGIASSMNVSSTTNISVGKNTVSITSSMAADKYQLTAMGGSSAQDHIQMFYDDFSTSYNIRNEKFASGSFTPSNVRLGSVVHGDLA